MSNPRLYIHLTIWATSHGLGPFRPAITDGHEIWCWPKEFKDKKEARDFATIKLSEARDAAREIVASWGLTKA